MASVKELKERIAGVRETKQITNAMYLVASTRLRHAREALEDTRPYFNALRQEMGRVFHADQQLLSRYFLGPDGALPANGVPALLVITGDKGLAGAYNMNVLRKTEQLLSERPGCRLYVIGEYGRRYFTTHHIPYEEDFLYTAQAPSQHISREICTRLLEQYEKGALDEIIMVYTDMKSSLAAEVRVHRLLPLAREGILDTVAPEARPTDFAYEPSLEAVLDMVMRSYLSGFIYSATVDSLCSEQNARVTAMDAANRNAEKLIDELSLQLNRERQAAITQEITEISAGAQGQRRRQGKEKQEAWQ